MRGALLVFLGSGLGGVARWALQSLAARTLGDGFPWGTLAINALGSWTLAIVVAVVARDAAADGSAAATSDTVKLFLATGLLGGFTTYSTFNQETLALIHGGHAGTAALYVSATLVLALGGAALAFTVLRTATS